MSVPQEVLKKVKLLELSTRKIINNLFAGEFKSAFKGQGMTFAEFREYVPGDDVRSISWPVTARAGKPFIKIYDEERETTVMLAVDVSGSNNFGSGDNFKGEIINHICALISYSAVKNNDPVGLVLFSDQIEHYVPPKKGRGQVHRMIRDLYYYEPNSKKTKISSALEHLMATTKKRSHMFIISDFLDDDYYDALNYLGKKNDVVAIVIEDPNEVDLPDMGMVDFEDLESGELITVDTSSVGFRREYKAKVLEKIEKRNVKLNKLNVDTVFVNTQEDYIDPLIRFFIKRKRK